LAVGKNAIGKKQLAKGNRQLAAVKEVVGKTQLAVGNHYI
jgi:hypothetical protein